jgi:hypothetical protein
MNKLFGITLLTVLLSGCASSVKAPTNFGAMCFVDTQENNIDKVKQPITYGMAQGHFYIDKKMNKIVFTELKIEYPSSQCVVLN